MNLLCKHRGLGSHWSVFPVLATAMLFGMLFGLGVLCSDASAQSWPQWRGPKFNGVSAESNPPVHWSREENVLWDLPLPGPAGSTPVVWDDKIFLTSVAENDLLLICISTAGKELWRRKIDSGNQVARKDEGNSASPSPCTDGGHVWAMFGTGALACFDYEGNRVWQIDLQERYGKFQIQFGMSSTPVLDNGRLYLQLIHGDGDAKTREAVVVCLEAISGKQIWLQPRKSEAQDECEHSYASPVIYRDSQQAFLITHGADYTIAHALKDGAELWRCGGFNPPGNYHPTLRFVASPTVGDDLIIIPTAKNGPIAAVRPSEVFAKLRSQKTPLDIALWRYPRNTPDVPSPVIGDGLVYFCKANGTLLCLEAETGEKVYQERMLDGRHRASPVLAAGKIYSTCRNGVVTVVRAGRKFEILAQNDVNEEIASSPVFCDGTLYLRTFKSLLAIREEKP